ncbi:MAG: methyltransferase domain-containing protein [Polyangiaceae bacterium]|nr:methyltransferase domain-containing protein [Polyangiaceae bacterium]
MINGSNGHTDSGGRNDLYPWGEDRTPRAARGLNVRAALRSGAPIGNEEFDDLLPEPIRAKSRIFWTPLDVALRASKMLVSEPGFRVLDVGSGAGKFCVVGALATEGEFVGIEQRAPLVECARDLAALVGATRATFTHGVFDALDPKNFDGFYFFNPFEENKFRDSSMSESDALRAENRFRTDVRNAQRFLRAARDGARVVTYNGLGGRMPRTYSLLHSVELGCTLELWVKDRG